MSLEKFIKKEGPISCHARESISDVARKMNEKNIGAAVVVEDKQPIGFITDRDIVLRLVSHGLDARKTTAKDLMTSPCRTIRADQGIFDAVRAIQEFGCRRLVIVDSSNHAVGIISAGDVIELLLSELNMLATVLTPNNQKLIPRKVA